jgi:multiple RNA-binding domain-containing protein 1
MGGESAWHSAHVRSDAAVDAVSQRLGVAKSDLLGLDGSGGGDAAVRMAVAETQVIEENRRYFEDEGVDLAILSSTAEKTRSDRVILAKNLHPSVSADELMQLFGVHGEVVRILLPPSRTVALIEFAESTEAGKAFRRLSFRFVLQLMCCRYLSPA